jgi:two-component system, LytTR family, sensor kinase
VHVGASLLISLIKLLLDRALRRMLFGFRDYVLITSLAPNILFYWAIVAAAHGLIYYHSSKERAIRASQLEARLAAAKLQLLQMQLHPHFLFNTLHTISELVHEDPETADRMIAGLSELLREALAASDVQEVPLRRELALVGRYLEIQHARFGDRLHVQVDVADDVLDALVPHLILQPIVENAIRHGIGSRAGRGRIRIAAARTADVLRVEIQDDGRGLQEANGAAIEGVGLGNTRQRLHALYGEGDRLTVSPAPGGGVTIAILIPHHVAVQRPEGSE